MKISTIKRTAALALLLTAWLFLPQSALSFYNPSTGRWLSRDPEDNGAEPYTFCRNVPISAIDVQGLSLWDDIKSIGSGWQDYFVNWWPNQCIDLTFAAKVKISGPSTKRINGCKFACCPLPTFAMAMIVEHVLQGYFPLKYHKECTIGNACCAKSILDLPANITLGFAMTFGPHGEPGRIAVGVPAGGDPFMWLWAGEITEFLEHNSGYRPTSVKTTCGFTGWLNFDGRVTGYWGDCSSKAAPPEVTPPYPTH